MLQILISPLPVIFSLCLSVSLSLQLQHICKAFYPIYYQIVYERRSCSERDMRGKQRVLGSDIKGIIVTGLQNVTKYIL